ncbi:beta-lactamase/transpeptidase-like protein [Aspergillus aurantiobrunneus]
MWKFLIVSALAALAAGETCPLAGPVFPAPRRAGSSAAFHRATGNFTTSLEQIMHSKNDSKTTAIDPDLSSLTVQVYSARDPKPLFEYYHTATTARNNTVGVNEVDENTVFRIGSVSKLWTVLLLLLEAGDASFHEPVSKYIPELQDAIDDLKENTFANEIDHVNWQDVTVGELASQLAGLARAYGLHDLSENPLSMLQLGLPPLPDSAVPKCGFEPTCERAEFFAHSMYRHPIVPTSASPVYSNDAFQLLGYIIEEISGRPVKELMEERLMEHLNLSSSSYRKPADAIGIIPAPENEPSWDVDMGELTSAGGLYSSTKDLSTLGRAILNNDLLSPALTRRWMKPRARTADPAFSVGAPWEIITLNDPRAIDLYTKSGDLGQYSAMVGLSPDHDVGFTMLAAGERTTATIWALADLISTTIIPGLEAVAKEEANCRFGGTYSSDDASLTLTTDDGPGLKITKWQNKGYDMLQSLASLQREDDVQEDIDIRLYPTGLEAPGKISFRSITSGPAPIGPANGPFTHRCVSWLLVDGQVYGSVGVDEFVFDMNQEGDAIRLSPRALRMSLSRNIK